MTRVIGFDTSGPYVCVAVWQDGEILAQAHEDMARGQAERLMGLLNETLSAADMSWADIDAIGVGVGPGNFTGIRISVAASRGLALGLGVPAIGVSLFEACAPKACTMRLALKAPRETLYVQDFADGMPVADPAHLPATEAGDVHLLTPEPHDLGERIAHCAAAKHRRGDISLAKPLYVKAPDAAPGRPAPAILS